MIAGRVPARESRKSSGVENGGTTCNLYWQEPAARQIAPTLPEVLFGAIKRISTWCRAGCSRARSFVQANCCRRSAMHVTPLTVDATRPSAAWAPENPPAWRVGTWSYARPPPSQSYEETVGSLSRAHLYHSLILDPVRLAERVSLNRGAAADLAVPFRPVSEPSPRRLDPSV